MNEKIGVNNKRTYDDDDDDDDAFWKYPSYSSMTRRQKQKERK